MSLADLFERWRTEVKPAGSTVTTWKGIVADFTRHLGQARHIQATEETAGLPALGRRRAVERSKTAFACE